MNNNIIKYILISLTSALFGYFIARIILMGIFATEFIY